MRLLHLPSLSLHEFLGDAPPYVITSHRWLEDEVTFQEFSSHHGPNGEVGHRVSQLSEKDGFKKIMGFGCAIAALMSTLCPNLKVEYMWIDTCCIDKTNSVELQEALNSMFRWYAAAEVCLAYLHDVDSLNEDPTTVRASLGNSVWFQRGWTLQELVAPRSILFYNKDWEIIGSKWPAAKAPWMSTRAFGMMPLNPLLAEITRIPEDVLYDFGRHIEQCSLEQRRSWMNGRSTTRQEDTVYCQLGIFGVFMPLLYGEGDHAMVRLEDAIEQRQRRLRLQSSKTLDSSQDSRPIYGTFYTRWTNLVAAPMSWL